MTDVKRINGRVMLVKFVMQDLILNMISVYAPQSGCDDSAKEKF